MVIPGERAAQVYDQPVGWRRRLELLVVQPTPFCNISCDYCYLPGRSDKRRMSLETFEAIVRRVFAEGLAGRELSLVWHAGEPLVVPIDWYRSAAAIVERHRPSDVVVTQNIQSNGILINRAWCDFFRASGVRIGLSIDGPARIHDAHRRTRDGRGTHAAVMRGVQTLRDEGVEFHAICVLSRESLRRADEIMDFFVELGARQVCFNIEEVEGTHVRSSLEFDGVEGEARAFVSRVLERLRSAPMMRVREVDDVLNALRHPAFGHLGGNSQNEAMRIMSVSWDGSFGTWSPELLGTEHPLYGPMTIGTLLDEAWIHAFTGDRYRRMDEDIVAGIMQCRRKCGYFAFCRGGAPSNKLGEHGSFAASDTMFCKLTQKVWIDATLAALEADLANAASASEWWKVRPPSSQGH